MESVRCPGCMRMKAERPLCEHCGYNEHIDNFPHQLPIGTMLQERYEVGKVLGQGGFGITYIGWDHMKQMTVAIKEFYPRSLVTRENTRSCAVNTLGQDMMELFDKSKSRFLKEAHTLARLNDIPEIVHIYGLFEENNTAYMVMEYLKGADLRRYIRMKGGRISLEKTLTVMRPIMRALHRVHQENLVHRDISPDNIMLMPGGVIKLLDFGAAREVLNADPNRNLSQSTETILKHGFAPIEQYQSSGTLGPWTDVYALTATIYYCLTGKIPPEAHKRLLDGAQVAWEDVPGLKPNQIMALEKAMALLPAERLRSVKELEDLLYTGIAEKPRAHDLDFHVEGGAAAEDGMKHSSVSAVDDWKFTSGGGIAQKEESRKVPGTPRKKAETGTVKKKPRWGILAAVLAVAVAIGGGALLLGGFGEKLADPIFAQQADRTIRYDDGTSVEIFLNDSEQETGRIIRDGENALRYQFTAAYNSSGKLTEQKAYDNRGQLLRTDEYTFDADGIMTDGESRDGDGSLLWEGETTYIDGTLTGFRETYADGREIHWTYDENANVTRGDFYGADGTLEKSIDYIEFQYWYDMDRESRVDYREAGKLAARGGYGASPMVNWGPGGGAGAPSKPQKPKKPIAVAITEPEETWEETTAPTEETEPATEPPRTPIPDVDLWVNTTRRELNGDGNLVRSYETSYDDQGHAVKEICKVYADGFEWLRHETEFLYSGHELIGLIQTYPDDTEMMIHYLRDISGNVVGTWTQVEDGHAEYEENDPAKTIAR